jgi:hypothetical protein
MVVASCRALRASLAALGLFLAAAVSAAQTQDASIIGQVTDESGAVLPGVTVTATSPAMQRGEISTVSDERGEYRLTPLPIGTYDIVYSLSGFQTVRREGVRLTVGFVAKLDLALKVGALEESVTVSGASPVVDVTSTSTTTQLTRETLELIPSTRNGILSLMAQAPGIRGNLDIGGSNFSAVPNFRAYGQNGEQWSTLEGVLTQAPVGNYSSGNYWDYSTFEETRVATVGKTVEVPSRGVQMQAVVKSGGNDFHGGAFYSQTNHNFQSANIDEALRAQGITSGNQLDNQWDVSGELGGRLVRNTLWFYGSVRRREMAQNILGVTKPEGGPAVHTQSQKFHTEKLSYQMTPGNRFVGFYQKGIKDEEGNNVNVLVPWESRTQGHIPTHTTKGEWQGVRGNVVASAQVGHWYYYADYYAHAGGKVATSDLVTQLVSGDSQQGDRQFFRNKRWHAAASVGWYKSNLLGGNHEFKVGGDFMRECCGIGQKVRRAGDYVLIFQSAVPFQIQAFNSPTEPKNYSYYSDIYGTDNWSITRRLTLNVGARFASNRSKVPAQCRAAGTFAPAACIDEIPFKTWNSVAPRVSLAYDVSGRGRSVIKAGWGRFDHARKLDRVADVNPFANTTTTYLWHDNNQNNLYETGEVNLDLNGTDYVTQTGAASAVPDPDQPQPKEDQAFAGFEHELMPNFAVRITGIYARLFNVPRRVNLLRPYEAYSIPITNLDPGPDGRPGSADDTGQSFTYYDYPASLAGIKYDLNMLTSPSGEPDHTFKTIEMAATRRLSGGWHLMASYSATRLHVPNAENASIDPNTEINSANETWEWVVRLSGAYLFPRGITVSANMENRSGDRTQRTVLFRGGRQIPTFVMNIEPVGSINLPPIRSLDLRVEKTVKLSSGHSLKGRLNVYNALNANTVTGLNTRSGVNFNRVTAITPPRLFELSATYAF